MANPPVVLLIGLTVIAARPVFAQMDRITGKPFATRSEVIAKNGMAATAQPLATEVAIDVLKKGGSAVDAAIAANATLGLMEPVSSGIGGDLFAIVWDAKAQKLYGINGSGRSPRGLSYDQMKAELAKLGLKATCSLLMSPEQSMPGSNCTTDSENYLSKTIWRRLFNTLPRGFL